MRVVTARSVALDALLRVVLDDAYLDRALPALCDKAQLGPEDRGLATELSFGVLRRQMWLDAIIAPHCDRPLKDIDPATLMALRIGAYQIHALDRIPAHAAVGETVAAVKTKRQSAASFVNAVLRKVSVAKPPHDYLNDPAATVEQLALDASVPPWILRAFNERLTSAPLLDEAKRVPPKGTATVNSIARALGRPAQPTLRVLSRRLQRDVLLARLVEQGADAQATPIAKTGIRVARIGDPSALPGFGYDFIAQDEAAQWAAELAAGEKGPVLDACAAPGGKALALWDAGLEPLTAIEAQPKRAELLRKTLEKAEIDCEIHTADAKWPPFDTLFPTVFVDAPCTGSGTLIRHPELRWKLDKNGISRLTNIQADILRGISKRVAPGGALIYAVCSVFAEEGEQQIAAFLKENPAFTLESWLETLSHHDTMDGFFAARLRLQRSKP